MNLIFRITSILDSTLVFAGSVEKEIQKRRPTRTRLQPAKKLIRKKLAEEIYK